MARTGVDTVGRAGLDDLAGVHHGNPVGQPGHHAEVVADHQKCSSMLLGDAPQQLQDLGLDAHVEGRRGLVGDDHLGFAGERHGDHYPLPHPARELVRIGVQLTLGARDADRCQQLGRSPPRLAVAHLQVQPQHLLHLEPDRSNRVQRRHRVLEHHRDVAAPDLLQVFLRHIQEVAALEADAAADFGGACRQEPRQREDGGALSAARLPDQRKRLALRQGEADSPHGMQQSLRRVETDPEILDG